MNNVISENSFDARVSAMLNAAIAICSLTVILVTTLGNSGGAPWVYFTYRSMLLAIAILCAIASRQNDERISPTFLTAVVALFGLMLVSVLRIPGSHFEG